MWERIRELQFFQEKEGELTIRIARAPSFSEAETEQVVMEEVSKRLDEDEFRVTIQFVDHASRSPRAKLGLLDQRLPIKLEDIS